MKKLFVEVADTPFKRERGLMNRHALGENEGMLFKFPQKTNLAFWMKNTYIPLDIAFLDDDGKVMQISEMFPLSTRSIQANHKCRYALETNKGWFNKNNVKIGSLIGNLGVSNIQRKAQIEPFDPAILQENPIPTTPTKEQAPPEQPPQPQQAQQVQQTQPAPSATLDMSIRNKIDYASNFNLPMTIVYTTQEGHTLPPRKLFPLKHEGYPIVSGPNGYSVKAYDTSPTLNIGGMEIEGGHPKSFLLNNIISLEVEEPKPPVQSPLLQKPPLNKKENTLKEKKNTLEK